MSKKELIKAVEAARELNQWIAEKISKARYQVYTDKIQIHETIAWQELDDSMNNGWLASFRDQFYEALKNAGEKPCP